MICIGAGIHGQWWTWSAQITSSALGEPQCRSESQKHCKHKMNICRKCNIFWRLHRIPNWKELRFGWNPNIFAACESAKHQLPKKKTDTKGIDTYLREVSFLLTRMHMSWSKSSSQYKSLYWSLTDSLNMSSLIPERDITYSPTKHAGNQHWGLNEVQRFDKQ